jgi:hypothetical protein
LHYQSTIPTLKSRLRLHLHIREHCRISCGDEVFASSDKEVNGWNISEIVFAMLVEQNIFTSCNLFVHWWSEEFAVRIVSLNVVYA